ncbi:DUF4270 family protein [Mucilaginibacter sp. Bleaf8]|uniref:DUF4270 family protein n=1 Tax=Mucilaginibacter sp. Bleaf8 TaxID=2834430 RepID=UPI001BCF075A|nr:DUF4270 family protein [Mucilaginibacter sp. Bleaf8]MBS7565886.1 DUF4270 family protein [Mucilaginibacter sp. Bleaf8]
MKFFRIDLLTLLISLFILGSCKNEDTVGLPLGDQEVKGTLVVDDNILVNTLKDDSINTNSLSKMPLASFNDSQIGETTGSIVSGLDLPGSTAYTLPTGTITTDSAVLELGYNDGFYGDSLTSKYKIDVYQLTEKPVTGQTYIGNRSWAHNSTVIGSNPAFNVRPKTRVKIYNIITGKKDTLYSVAPHIRVPINTTFINNNFFGAPATQLSSLSNFQNAVKGLYITLQRNGGPGGVVMIHPDSCRIKVYYRANNAGTIDTAVASLPFTRATTSSGAVARANAVEIRHTYNQEITAQLNNPKQSYDQFYLQGGGLRARIRFPELGKLFGADSTKVVLNKAELIITPEAGTGVPYKALPQLTMYRSDIALQRQLLPDANGSGNTIYDPYYLSTAIFGGRLDATKQQYRFIVTGYIQKLLNKTLTDYGTYIAPIDTNFTAATSIPIASTAATAARTIAIGSNKSSAGRIKLNIIYTKQN